MTTSFPKVILHVGLHKTGTTFLQKRVFTELDHHVVAYNPEPIISSIRHLYRLQYDSVYWMQCLKIIRSNLSRISQRTLLLSHEIYSGTPWTNYHDIEEMTDFLQEAFPDGEIILVFRNHGDWLESLYRESIRDGNISRPDVFFNYHDGAFRPRSSITERNVNSLDFSFNKILGVYERKFKNVHVFHYETLRDTPRLFFSELENVTCCKLRDITNENIYRSCSALSISILLLVSRIPIIRSAVVIGRFSPFPYLERLAIKYHKVENLFGGTIKNYSFVQIIFLTIHRGLLFFGLGEKLMRKRRIKRIRFFIEKLEKVVYKDWDILSVKKRAIIAEFYKDKDGDIDFR